ncbi:22622_t:CDS:2, partial [Dentiscutata erythropus]
LLNHRTYDDFSVPKCYGISQHPSTKEYILVFNYYEQGDLRALLADRGDLWAYYSEHLGALKPTNNEITKRSRNSHYEILTNTHPDAVYYSRPINKFTSQP